MNWVQIVATVFCTTMASSGFWAFLASRKKTEDAYSRLMLGLAHDRIVSRGVKLINQGYVTFDEYEDFMKYLAEPYSTFGGNGMAEKIIERVKTLDVVSRAYDEKQGRDRANAQQRAEKSQPYGD